MPSQWQAVGAHTDLLARARVLQRRWDRLLGEGGLGAELSPEATAGLRPAIVESWRRTLATGVGSIDPLPSIEADPSETRERWLEHPLGLLRHVLAEPLQLLAEESNSLVQVTDASGLTLYLGGAEWLKARAAEMNLVEGARCSETVNGTNGVGTALAADHPVQVFAFEHFSYHHREWVCSGAPIHDRVSGRLVGIIDLSSPWRIAHPRSLELVTAAARTTEQCLLEGRRDHDARLRRRYGDLTTKTSDLLVNREGYLLIGDDLAHPKPLDIPENGGEIAMGDGSLAVAEPLGRGEAYLVRRLASRRVRAARAETLERAEKRARELATEQAALRQVATLVAYESSADRLIAVVVEQVARVFDVPLVRLIRYEPTAAVVVGGFSESDDEPFPIGSRWQLDAPGLLATIRHTGRAARVEDYAQAPGDGAGAVRAAGMRSAVGTPIVVGGRVWGAIVLLSPRRASLPEDTGARLADFTDLVATALANAESRAALSQLADEQAALRRVATLVAREASPVELLATVAEEVARVLDVEAIGMLRFEPDGTATLVAQSDTPWDPPPLGTRFTLEGENVVTAVFRTREAARLDDWAQATGPVAEMARVLGIRSSVATPIVVEGRLWGTLIAVTSQSEPIPRETDLRIGEFTELVATAIANAGARDDLAASEARARDLAGEQAALRRVATLVAKGVSSDELFAAVTREVADVLDVPVVALQRYEADRMFTMVAIAGETSFTVGSRWPVEDDGLAGMILATGRPARKQGYTTMPGPLGAALRDGGFTSGVGVPIVVEGSIWGFITAGARPGKPTPDGTEERLARFTELVATAIADSQAREQLAQLAYEQAALRRVATLVARGVSPEEIFSAVTNEMGRLFDSSQAYVGRFEPDGSAMVVVGVSDGIRGVSAGSRWELEDYMASTGVYQTGRHARVERSDFEHISGRMADLLREIGAVSSVGAPIVVEGQQWGFVTVTDTNKRLPFNAEKRLEKFAELVATAIANAESRGELAASEARARELAEEQASLRRVATLVARGANAEEIFSAAAREVADVFSVELVTVCLYEADGMLVLSSVGVPAFPAGSRWPLDVPSLPASVYLTRGPVRMDDFTDAEGLDAIARDGGVKSAVGVPIVIDGAVWGSINTASTKAGPFPADAEERLARFTDLIATAVSKAAMRAELAASRARVIAAADESRRRIERDLHDGAQQQLVTLAVALQRAQAKIPSALDEVRADVGRVADGLTGAVNELRDLSRGIHPAILTEGGLSPALKALGRRSEVRVKLEVGFEHRLPDQVEVAAYYTVSEALTNASKHANATRVWVSLRVDGDMLLLSVRDDGVGGADPSRGSGLTGLRDRIEALGGRIKIESPSGSGTLIEVEIPIAGPAGRKDEPDELPARAATPGSSG